MKTVAILGSNGFLGSYISKNLKDYKILNVTRNSLDLTNYDAVKNWLSVNSPDVIVNCATAGGKTKMGDINFQDLKNNLSIFLNFYNNSNLVKKFINIGSGSEFDISRNIANEVEENIFKYSPNETYGFSKNTISRMIYDKHNFHTLRLFGCFDISEPDFRFFKKALRGEIYELSDRYFDYISASDFLIILNYFIENDNLPKDINCVYEKKYKLSELLSLLNVNIGVVKNSSNNYTGDSKKLESLDLNLIGLIKNIEYYLTGK